MENFRNVLKRKPRSEESPTVQELRLKLRLLLVQPEALPSPPRSPSPFRPFNPLSRKFW